MAEIDYDDVDDNVGELVLEQGVYVGGWRAATNESWLSAKEIGLVVTLGTRPLTREEGGYRRYVFLPFEDHSHEVIDRPNVWGMLELVHRTSIQDKVNILIHCFAGRARSFILVLLYMMKYPRMRLNVARAEIVRMRGGTKLPPINMVFEVQLETVERQLFRLGHEDQGSKRTRRPPRRIARPKVHYDNDDDDDSSGCRLM